MKKQICIILALLFQLLTVAAYAQCNSYHVVSKGETLYRISKMYDVKVDEIVRLNPGCEKVLFVGQKLKIKEKEGIEKQKPNATIGVINGYEYVDLGLPSGVRWASCNVGAIKPEDYGNHYAWGEAEIKRDYSEETYKWCNGTFFKLTKYCSDSEYGRVDNKNRLEQSDDVASKEWGSSWCLPAKADFDELQDENNCIWEWTTQNGVNGCKVTSKRNGNSIFLPAAGWCDGTSLDDRGKGGGYWSSTPDSRHAYSLVVDNYGHGNIWNYRYLGLCIRPVSRGVKSNEEESGAQQQNKKLNANMKNQNKARTYDDFNGHEYVDLGLSVKWATCNVGAIKPEDYGNHYAWGETSFMAGNNFDSIYENMSDIDGKPQYDVARKEWGGSWRIPKIAEFQELIDSCNWQWTRQNGINGYKITSKKNGNSIFLPASGWRHYDTSFYYRGTLGYYWSSTPYDHNGHSNEDAFGLDFSSGGYSMDISCRYRGHCVRPVSE